MSKYKKGLAGKKAEKYLNMVGQLTQKAESNINAGKKIANEKDKNNELSDIKYRDSLRKINERLEQRLKSYAVIVDDDKYDYVQRKIKANSELMARKISYVLDRIDSLCKEEYILPDTTPKIEAIIRAARTNMPEFEEIAGDISEISKRYLIDMDKEV